MKVAAPLLGLALFGWAFSTWVEGSRIDYGALPPAEILQQVTGSPAPSGISRLRAAGRSSGLGLKHWVWLSFTFKGGGRELTESAIPLPPDEAREALHTDYSVGDARAPRDREAVQWAEVARIRNPEVYQIGSSRPGTTFIWSGLLILDRAAKRAYIHASGD